MRTMYVHLHECDCCDSFVVQLNWSENKSQVVFVWFGSDWVLQVLFGFVLATLGVGQQTVQVAGTITVQPISNPETSHKLQVLRPTFKLNPTKIFILSYTLVTIYIPIICIIILTINILIVKLTLIRQYQGTSRSF